MQVPALVPQQLAAVLGALRPLLQHLAQALQNETFALQQVSSSLGGLLLSLFETIHNPLTNVAVAKNCLLASAILTTAATSLSMNAGVQDAHVAVLVSSLARPEEDVRVAAVQCIRSLLTVHPFMIAGVPEVVLMLTDGTLASLPVVQESAKLFTALVAVATTDPTSMLLFSPFYLFINNYGYRCRNGGVERDGARPREPAVWIQCGCCRCGPPGALAGGSACTAGFQDGRSQPLAL